MSNLGWISLYRQIMDSWLWKDKPFAYGQAWIDMLLMANHEDNDILFEGKILTIHRGAFHTSILKLSDRYGWNRKKTTKFLDLLESQKMVTTERTTHGTTVSIVNYDKFQTLVTTIDTTNRATLGTTKEQPRDTNNNDNNDNNVNNNIICSDSAEPSPKQNNKKFTPPNLEEVQQYCIERNNSVNAQTFIDFYESKGWMVGKNKMKDWKAAVRTWERNSKTSKGVNETSGNSIYDTNAGWERAKRAIAEAKHNSAGGEDLPFK